MFRFMTRTEGLRTKTYTTSMKSVVEISECSMLA